MANKIPPVPALVVTRNPIVDKNGMASWDFLKILQAWSMQIANSLNQLGRFVGIISPDATVDGRAGTVGTALQNLTSAGELNATALTGQIRPAQLPTPTLGSIGAIQANNPVENHWITAIGENGVPELSQPGFSSLSGQASTAQLPIATAASLGIVQPDGNTIKVDATGKISAPSSGITQLAGDVTAGPGSGSQAAQVVATHLAAPLPVAQGGSGTATPSLVAGANVTISGAWPNQTVAATSGSSIDLQTDGVDNTDQSKLNLIAGTNVTLAADALGGVTITASGGGGGGLSLSNYQLYDGTNYWIFPPAAQCVIPVASNFSWINQPAGSTEVASGGQLSLQCAAITSGTGALTTRGRAIGPSTELTAFLAPVLAGAGSAGSNALACIFFYESATGKYLTLQFGYNNGPTEIMMWYWTSASAASSVVASVTAAVTYALLRLQISGSSLIFFYSLNGGATWLQLYSEAKTAHFSVGPDQWGYGVSPWGTLNFPQTNNVLSWEES